MKAFLCCLILTITGLVVWNAMRSFEEVSFSCGGFHPMSVADLPKAAEDLESHVLGLGFEPGGPPSAMSASAGVHSAGEINSWYKGNTDKTRDVYVRLTRTKWAVEMGIVWSVRGFRYEIRDTKIRAMQVAKDLARWQEARPEEQVMFDSMRDDLLKMIEKKLAESYRE